LVAGDIGGIDIEGATGAAVLNASATCILGTDDNNKTTTVMQTVVNQTRFTLL